MPKQNQKLRLLYLREILLTQTDKNHLLTVNEIIEILSEYGISAERKTIYDDIKALWESGVDVVW